MTDENPQVLVTAEAAMSDETAETDPRRASGRASRREQSPQTTWLPLLSLLFGVLGVALSPLFGVGVIPSTAGLVAGHMARRRFAPLRRQATLGVVVSAVGWVASGVVGVIVLEPMIEQLLVTVGFLLP